jgi:hypothetical protein
MNSDVRITGQRRPDRDTISRSSADRDYRMSTYDNASGRHHSCFIEDILDPADAMKQMLPPLIQQLL